MAGVKGKSGGSRPGAGKKAAKQRKTKAKVYQTDDPDDFLRALMRDARADFKDRLAAALALKKGGKVSGSPGKKERQAQAAKDLVRPTLAPLPAPTRPRLVAVK
jgi:phage terminase small subunit